MTKLPCGCEMWKDGEKFYIIPCSPDCEYFQYALEESRKRGNEIVYDFKIGKRKVDKNEKYQVGGSVGCW